MIKPGDFILPGFSPSFCRALLPERGKRYTEAQAIVSLLLDMDAGTIKPQRAYGRIWGWSHKAVRYRWERIWQTVTRAACSNGRQLHGAARTPFVDKLPADWEAWAQTEYPPARGAHGEAASGAHEMEKRAHKQAPQSSSSPNRGTDADERGTVPPCSGAQQGHTTSHPSSFILEGESRTEGQGPKGFALDGAPVNAALEAYAEAVGQRPHPVHAAAIERRFPEATDSGLITAWKEHVTTYVVTDSRNAQNVPGIILTFDEHVNRSKHPSRTPQRPNNSSSQSGWEDPASAHERVLADARSALGVG